MALFSCGEADKVDDQNNSSVSQDIEGADDNIVMDEGGVVKNPQAFFDNLEAHKSCKAQSVKRGGCKEFTSKAVCEAYGIDDLKEGDNYIDYDKIPAKISELSNWEKIGALTEDNLVKAQEILNSYKRPVLVFNTKEKYVQVVVLKENGSSTVSNKWGGLKVPTCISYFPSRPNASFTDKGLNYAFKSADGLEIWARKN